MVGKTLTATVDTNSNGTKSYQWWYAESSTATSGTNISGATSSTYTVGSSLVGKYIGCTVTVASTTNYNSATGNDITDATNNDTSKVIPENPSGDTPSLSVKPGKGDKVIIDGYDIYLKLDQTSSGKDHNTYFSSLWEYIEGLDNIHSVQFNVWGPTAVGNSNYTLYSDGTDGNALDNRSTTVLENSYIFLNNTNTSYKIHLYGDICYNNSEDLIGHNDRTVIDLDDVTYLRKAIVGYSETEIVEKNSGMRKQYTVLTTDVNNSSSSQIPTKILGDIGDVIEIRRRIVNGHWDNNIN